MIISNPIFTNEATIIGEFAAREVTKLTKLSTSVLNAAGAMATSSLIAITKAKNPRPAINTDDAANIAETPNDIKVPAKMARPPLTRLARAPAANRMAKLPARATKATPTATKLRVDNSIIGTANAIKPAPSRTN